MNTLSVEHYIKALTKAPQLPFYDLKGKELRLVYNEKNNLIRFFGRTSVVFKLTDGHNFFALKCYTTGLNYRWEYLANVRQKLRSLNKDWIVPFDIYENVLSVENDESRPISCNILLMPWIEGDRLTERVQYFCSRESLNSNLSALFQSLVTLANQQIPQSFSHGDISPANIIVTHTGKMMLIDHDSFTFEGWESVRGQDGWTFAYQHSSRNPGKPDLKADHFSFLVLATSLKAVELNPGLYQQFNSSKGLLFNIDDFKYPDESKLIAEIRKIGDPYLQELLSMLLDRLKSNSTSVSGLLNILNVSNDKPAGEVKEWNSDNFSEIERKLEDNSIKETAPFSSQIPDKIEFFKTDNNQKEKFFQEELEKDFLEKERLQKEKLKLFEPLNEDHQKTELELQGLLKVTYQKEKLDSIHNKKKGMEKAEVERIQLLQEMTRQDEMLLFKKKKAGQAETDNIFIEQQKNKFSTAHHKRRKKIRTSVGVALASVMIIIMGIKILFPGTKIVIPVDYKHLGTSDKMKSDEKINPGMTDEIEKTANPENNKDANNSLTILQKQVVQLEDKVTDQDMQQGKDRDISTIGQKKQKKFYQAKKYNNNSVTFRKSGF